MVIPGRFVVGVGGLAMAGAGVTVDAVDEHGQHRGVAAALMVAGTASVAYGAALQFGRAFRPELRDVVLGAVPMGSGHVLRSQVDAFLAGSQVREVMLHATGPTGYRRIVAEGIDVAAGQGSFGQGFYTADRHIWRFGVRSVPVAIRTERPFVVAGPFSAANRWSRAGEFQSAAIQPLVDAYRADVLLVAPGRAKELAAMDVQELGRRALLHAGYDSIVVESGAKMGPGRWVVALDPDKVKVVVADP
jgi:hypothetical protein